ncbi:hypothetical protein [Empedobacter brevis]
MKNFLNTPIKLKHLLAVLVFVGIAKFGIEIYKSFYYMNITKNVSAEEAANLIMKEKYEKWWLRL